MSEGPRNPDDALLDRLSELWSEVTHNGQRDPELHVLTESFQHLDAEHIHHNKVIHQTFYLSVVFFAAIVSVAVPGSRQTWYVIGAGVLVLAVLGISTKMYLTSREQVKRKKRLVIEELDEFDLSFEHADSVQELTYTTVRGDQIEGDDLDHFEEEFERKFPQQYKAKFQMTYYYVIIFALVAIGLIVYPP